MVLSYSKKELEQELLDHNDFFDMLVDMIPSKLYVASKNDDAFNPRYFKGASKTDSKEARKAASKASKRRKLDPVLAAAKKQKEKNAAVSKLAAGTAEESSDATTATAAAVGVVAATGSSSSRIEALRAKLHAKIASKQQQQGNYHRGPAGGPEAVSKRAARRAEKNKRQEQAKKRSNSAVQPHAAAKPTYTVAAAAATAAAPVAPTVDLEQIDFGRLAGLDAAATAGDGAKKQNYNATNKSLQNLSKGKNLHKLLADAEQKRLKLLKLKGTDQGKSMEWSDTFREADGVRVLDDPKKLKKAIKTKAAKKKKSQKAWKVRTEQTLHATKTKQQVRSHNLQARRQGGTVAANLSKKKIVDEKKDKAGRAGFEGRFKQGFINSPKGGHGEVRSAAAASASSGKKKTGANGKKGQ